MADFQPDVRRIQKTSRRAAIIGLFGGLLILVSIIASTFQIMMLQSRRAKLHDEVSNLEEKKRIDRSQIVTLELQLQALRDTSDLASAQIIQGHTAAAVKTLTAEQIRTSVPRIYFQIRSKEQVPIYQKCAADLNSIGVRVPPYQLVNAGPSRSEFRYYHTNELSKVNYLARLLSSCLGSSVHISNFGEKYSNVNPFHYEVWLPLTP